MAINFQATMAKAPNQLPDEGYYYGRISAAEMKQPKDTTKNEYLNVTYDLLNANHVKCGVVFDIVSESDKPMMIYKLQRFGQALGLTGKSLELRDLPKIIIGKTIIFRVKIDRNEQYGDRAVVDIGDEGIYYAKSEENSFFSLTPTPNAPAPITPTDNDSAPFDVGDDPEEF